MCNQTGTFCADSSEFSFHSVTKYSWKIVEFYSIGDSISASSHKGD